MKKKEALQQELSEQGELIVVVNEGQARSSKPL